MYVYYVLDQNSTPKPSQNSLERPWQESSESEICSQQPFTTLQAYDNSEVLQCSAKQSLSKELLTPKNNRLANRLLNDAGRETGNHMSYI